MTVIFRSLIYQRQVLSFIIHSLKLMTVAVLLLLLVVVVTILNWRGRSEDRR